MGKRIYQNSPEKNEARKKQQAEWWQKKKEEEKSLAERQKEVEATAAALEKAGRSPKEEAGRTTKNKNTPPAVTVGPKKTPRKVTPDTEIGQATAPAKETDDYDFIDQIIPIRSQSSPQASPRRKSKKKSKVVKSPTQRPAPKLDEALPSPRRKSKAPSSKAKAKIHHRPVPSLDSALASPCKTKKAWMKKKRKKAATASSLSTTLIPAGIGIPEEALASPPRQKSTSFRATEEYSYLSPNEEETCEVSDQGEATDDDDEAPLATNKSKVFFEGVNLNKAAQSFLGEVYSIAKKWSYHCPKCCGRGPFNPKSGMGNHCQPCQTSMLATSFKIPKMGSANDMNPFPNKQKSYPFRGTLKPPNRLEAMMQSQVVGHMSILRLPGGASKAYKGGVINVQKDDFEEWVQTVPRRIEDSPIYLVLRRSIATSPNSGELFADHRLNKTRLLELLRAYIKIGVPGYEALTEHNIDHEYLNKLGDNADIVGRMKVVIEEDIEEDDLSYSPSKDGDGDNEDDHLEDGKWFDDAMDKEEETDFLAQKDPDTCGPEQGGATGPLPGENETLRRAPVDYLEISMDPAATETAAEFLRRHFVGDVQDETDYGTAEKPLPFSTKGSKMYEYGTPGIQSLAYPHLFCYGLGDHTKPDRPIGVSENEANKHLLWSAVKKDDRSFMYPFAMDDTWMYWAQNRDERQRHRGQKNQFINKNSNYSSMRNEDLERILKEGDTRELKELVGKMESYNSNLLGSNAYLRNHRRYLQATMESLGMSSVWFTLSAADNHWKDLHQMNEIPWNDSWTEGQKAQARRKFVRENPHIVDSFFCHRANAFLEIMYGSKYLDANYHWGRFEYQQRGTVHMHGCARLANDPGLCERGQQVYHARLAQLRLIQEFDIDMVDSGGFTKEELECDHYETCYSDMKTPVDKAQGLITKLKAILTIGVQAHETLVSYHDSLLTTMHPDPPSDAQADHRSESTMFDPSIEDSAHPCSKDPREIFKMSQADQTQHYCVLLNAVQRHKCSESYCLKNGSCRFNFPLPIRKRTIVTVIENKMKDGRVKKRVEMLSKRNDRWLQSHNRTFLMAWQANMDMRLTIDTEAIVQYMTKYVTKLESGESRNSKAFLFNSLRRSYDKNLETESILKRLMTQVFGSRPRSQQETCHMINGYPMVKNSATVKIVKLHNNKARVTSEVKDGKVEKMTQHMTLIDGYAVREEVQHWLEEADYHDACRNGMVQMNLDTFSKHFVVGQSGSHRNKIKLIDKSKTHVTYFQPRLPNNPKAQTYTEYCKLSCVRYIVWRKYYSTAFGGEAAHGAQDPDEETIRRTWESYVQSQRDKGLEAPDHFHHEFERNIHDSDNKNKDPSSKGGLVTDDGQTGGEVIQEEDVHDCLYDLGKNALVEEEDFDVDWNRDHDCKLHHDYTSLRQDAKEG